MSETTADKTSERSRSTLSDLLDVVKSMDGTAKFIWSLVALVVLFPSALKITDFLGATGSESYAQQVSVDSVKADVAAVKEDVKFLQTTVKMQTQSLEQTLMKVQVKLAKMDGDIDEDDADALNDQISAGFIRAGELQTKILEFKRQRQ